MDGKHRNPSLALVFASVPIQALLMAGVAAALLSSASSPQVQYGYSYSVTNPSGGQVGYVWVKPVCVNGNGIKGPQAGSVQYGAPLPGSLACPVYAGPGAQP